MSGSGDVMMNATEEVEQRAMAAAADASTTMGVPRDSKDPPEQGKPKQSGEDDAFSTFIDLVDDGDDESGKLDMEDDTSGDSMNLPVSFPSLIIPNVSSPMSTTSPGSLGGMSLGSVMPLSMGMGMVGTSAPLESPGCFVPDGGMHGHHHHHHPFHTSNHSLFRDATLSSLPTDMMAADLSASWPAPHLQGGKIDQFQFNFRAGEQTDNTTSTSAASSAGSVTESTAASSISTESTTSGSTKAGSKKRKLDRKTSEPALSSLVSPPAAAASLPSTNAVSVKQEPNAPAPAGSSTPANASKGKSRKRCSSASTITATSVATKKKCSSVSSGAAAAAATGANKAGAQPSSAASDAGVASCTASKSSTSASSSSPASVSPSSAASAEQVSQQSFSNLLASRVPSSKRPSPAASQQVTESGKPFPVIDTSAPHSSLFVHPDVSGLNKREARLVKNRAAAFLSRQRRREQYEELDLKCQSLSRLSWILWEILHGDDLQGESPRAAVGRKVGTLDPDVALTLQQVVSKAGAPVAPATEDAPSSVYKYAYALTEPKPTIEEMLKAAFSGKKSVGSGARKKTTDSDVQMGGVPIKQEGSQAQDDELAKLREEVRALKKKEEEYKVKLAEAEQRASASGFAFPAYPPGPNAMPPASMASPHHLMAPHPMQVHPTFGAGGMPGMVPHTVGPYPFPMQAPFSGWAGFHPMPSPLPPAPAHAHTFTQNGGAVPPFSSLSPAGLAAAAAANGAPTAASMPPLAGCAPSPCPPFVAPPWHDSYAAFKANPNLEVTLAPGTTTSKDPTSTAPRRGRPRADSDAGRSTPKMDRWVGLSRSLSTTSMGSLSAFGGSLEKSKGEESGLTSALDLAVGRGIDDVQEDMDGDATMMFASETLSDASDSTDSKEESVSLQTSRKAASRMALMVILLGFAFFGLPGSTEMGKMGVSRQAGESSNAAISRLLSSMPTFEAPRRSKRSDKERTDPVPVDGNSSPSSHLTNQDLTATKTIGDQDDHDIDLTEDQPLSVCGAAGSSASSTLVDECGTTSTHSKDAKGKSRAMPSPVGNTNAQSVADRYDPLREWLAKSLEIDLASLRLGDRGDDEEDEEDEDEDGQAASDHVDHSTSDHPASSETSLVGPNTATKSQHQHVQHRNRKGRRLEMRELAPFLAQSGFDVDKGFILVDAARDASDTGHKGSRDALLDGNAAKETGASSRSEEGKVKGSHNVSPSRLSVFLPALDPVGKAGEDAEDEVAEDTDRNEEADTTADQDAGTPVPDESHPTKVRVRSQSMMTTVDALAARAEANSLSATNIASPEDMSGDMEGLPQSPRPSARIGASSSTDSLSSTNRRRTHGNARSGTPRSGFLTTTKAAEAEDAGAKPKRRVTAPRGRAFVELEFTFSGARLAHVL